MGKGAGPVSVFVDFGSVPRQRGGGQQTYQDAHSKNQPHRLVRTFLDDPIGRFGARTCPLPDTAHPYFQQLLAIAQNHFDIFQQLFQSHVLSVFDLVVHEREFVGARARNKWGVHLISCHENWRENAGEGIGSFSVGGSALTMLLKNSARTVRCILEVHSLCLFRILMIPKTFVPPLRDEASEGIYVPDNWLTFSASLRLLARRWLSKN